MTSQLKVNRFLMNVKIDLGAQVELYLPGNFTRHNIHPFLPDYLSTALSHCTMALIHNGAVETVVQVPGLTRLAYDCKAENRAEDVGVSLPGVLGGQAIRAPLQTAFHIVPEETARSVWPAPHLCPHISRHLVLCTLIEKLFIQHCAHSRMPATE